MYGGDGVFDITVLIDGFVDITVVFLVGIYHVFWIEEEER